jgi:hypothetical protein
MKAGTALKYTASDGKPLCVGDAFEYEGQQFFVSPFGSALDLSGEAFPLSKMSPDKIIRNTAGASAFCAVKSDAPEPVMAADISIFTDEDIAAELQRRGYVGTLTRTKTITL